MEARISTDSGDMCTFLQHFESGAAALEGWNRLDHVHLMVNEERALLRASSLRPPSYWFALLRPATLCPRPEWVNRQGVEVYPRRLRTIALGLRVALD